MTAKDLRARIAPLARLSLLASLSAALPAEAAASITLWHAYRGKERDGIEQVQAAFNASQKDIELQLVPIPYDAFADKVTASIPRGKGPDLFIFAQDRLGDWAAAGLIEPLDFWMTDALRGAFLEPTLEAVTYDNVVYGLPMAFKTVALFYNTKLVLAPPKTTDELVAVAKRATGKGTFGLVYENANFYYQAAWMNGFGGRVFDKKGKPTLASPQVIESMAFAADLAHAQGIMPQEVTSTLTTTLFNQGKAAMVINGPWFLGEIDAGVPFAVALLPVISKTNARAKPFLSSESVILSNKSAHKKEAFAVMEFLTGPVAGKIMATVGRQPSARRDVYDDPAVAKDPILAIFREQLKSSVPMPNAPAMRMVWSPATTAMNKIINGKADPKATMETCQAEVAGLVQGAKR